MADSFKIKGAEVTDGDGEPEDGEYIRRTIEIFIRRLERGVDSGKIGPSTALATPMMVAALLCRAKLPEDLFGKAADDMAAALRDLIKTGRGQVGDGDFQIHEIEVDDGDETDEETLH